MPCEHVLPDDAHLFDVDLRHYVFLCFPECPVIHRVDCYGSGITTCNRTCQPRTLEQEIQRELEMISFTFMQFRISDEKKHVVCSVMGTMDEY